MVDFDYSKLEGKITEICGTQSAYSKKAGISEHSLSRKLSSQVPFKQEEMLLAAEILEFDVKEIPDYFFTLKVQFS